MKRSQEKELFTDLEQDFDLEMVSQHLRESRSTYKSAPKGLGSASFAAERGVYLLCGKRRTARQEGKNIACTPPTVPTSSKDGHVDMTEAGDEYHHRMYLDPV